MTAEDLAALIVGDVTHALTVNDIAQRHALLRAAGRAIFEIAYEESGGDPDIAEREASDFTNTLTAAINATLPDESEGQAARIAAVFARAALNGAIVAAGGGLTASRTWITMLDDKVRELHRPMHGVTVAAGERFVVDGHPLRYPGEPVGPPEVWINCRCTVALGLTAAGEEEPMDALIAVSDTPWSQFSTSDYTLAQWKRACLLKMPDGDPEAKSTYKLPVREPGGALNRNGVHAAASALAGGRGGVNAPAAAKAAAASKLRGLYRQLGEEVPDSLKADGEADDLVAVSAPGTHDAPGWITHPRETQRLRTYWTKGPGAAKIRWGTPGDLTRCHRNLEKYVGPFAWGTCQNMHKEALGYYNPESRGRHGGGDPDEMIDMIDAAFAAAAELEDTMDTPAALEPPSEWFRDPGFDAPTPLTISADGRVLGHLATWDTCHVGISGDCVKPPRSKTGYAYFRTGEVATREGEMVAVGAITMDTGHASTDASPAATVAHYDDTGTAVADVAAGEDNYGIWVAGAMRPGVSEAQMYNLRATGALSGDWRRIGGNLELVAALAVNVPGFPIPRVAMAASAGRELALVAAAVVTSDPNALDADRVAVAVLARLDEREAAKARAVRASALVTQIAAVRAEAILAAVH